MLAAVRRGRARGEVGGVDQVGEGLELGDRRGAEVSGGAGGGLERASASTCQSGPHTVVTVAGSGGSADSNGHTWTLAIGVTRRWPSQWSPLVAAVKTYTI